MHKHDFCGEQIIYTCAILAIKKYVCMIFCGEAPGGHREFVGGMCPPPPQTSRLKLRPWNENRRKYEFKEKKHYKNWTDLALIFVYKMDSYNSTDSSTSTACISLAFASFIGRYSQRVTNFSEWLTGILVTSFMEHHFVPYSLYIWIAVNSATNDWNNLNLIIKWTFILEQILF